MSFSGYPQLGLLIDGEWITGKGRKTEAVFNPATGEAFAELTLATPEDIDAAAVAAARGFQVWRRVSAYDRARTLSDVATRLRADEDRLAQILTTEQGKPLFEARLEVRSSADTFEWMAEEGKRAYGRIVPARTPNTEQYAKFEPIGPVAAFSPWNFPATLGSRKIATALAAGCSIVLKPAEETPGIMVAIAAHCIEAGVPPGVLNLLFGAPAEVSSRLIASPHIKKISFTGSISVGRHLASQAAAVLKKITLELGGHAPVVVMGDVDVERVVDLTMAAKFRNAGQICVCPTRFYVHDAVHDRFVSSLAKRAAALRLGDGSDSATEMGPLANKRRVQAMAALCDDALSRGAQVVAGGGQPKGLERGFFWSPTVIADIPQDAAAMTQEPFGPLAMVTRFDDLDKALRLANASECGLAAYGFTNSIQDAHRIETEVESGNVSINTFLVTAPEMPFGGIKSSGLGSEMGCEGLLEHMNLKSVVRSI